MYRCFTNLSASKPGVIKCALMERCLKLFCATALGLAAHHPDTVDRLAVISASHQTDSIYESVRAGWPQMSAEMLANTPMEAAYMAVASEPERFAVLVDKIRDAMLAGMGWEDDEMRAIGAPTLLVVGDTDIVQPAKVLELFELLGGASSDGPMGPQVNPDRQFAVLPNVTHIRHHVHHRGRA